MAMRQHQSIREQLGLREKHKQQELLLKALETPEKKRAGRLAKKDAKACKRHLKMGLGEDFMGYSNSDNPFGNNNLLDTFIWRKALEKKGMAAVGEGGGTLPVLEGAEAQLPLEASQASLQDLNPRWSCQAHRPARQVHQWRR